MAGPMQVDFLAQAKELLQQVNEQANEKKRPPGGPRKKWKWWNNGDLQKDEVFGQEPAVLLATLLEIVASKLPGDKGKFSGYLLSKQALEFAAKGCNRFKKDDPICSLLGHDGIQTFSRLWTNQKR